MFFDGAYGSTRSQQEAARHSEADSRRLFETKCSTTFCLCRDELLHPHRRSYSGFAAPTQATEATNICACHQVVDLWWASKIPGRAMPMLHSRHACYGISAHLLLQQRLAVINHPGPEVRATDQDFFMGECGEQHR